MQCNTPNYGGKAVLPRCATRFSTQVSNQPRRRQILKIHEDQQAINAIVERIDRLRYARGLSLYALAQKADLSENTLKHIYKRRSYPNTNTIYRLCEALEIPVWQFFFFEETTAVFTKEELMLLEAYERINPVSREALLGVARQLK